LKSHTPRLFSGEKSKEPLLSRRSCSLCSSQGPHRNRAGFEAAVRDVAGTPHRSAGSTTSVTPVLPWQRSRDCPLPQNRAVNTRLVGSRWCRRRPGRSEERLAGTPRSRLIDLPSNQCSTWEHARHSQNIRLGPRQCCSLERR
jgi:hypothetical protein